MEATLERTKGGFGGLNGFQLKLFALITMTMDHLAAYLPAGANIPDWFHLIGRFAAPLFVFFCAEGFYYTHSRKMYVGRLYIGAVLMAFGNNLINRLFMQDSGVIVTNAMFSTMFLITLTLWSIESLRAGVREKARGKMVGGLLGLLYLIVGAAANLALFFALNARLGPDGMMPQDTATLLLQQVTRAFSLLVPNLLMAEGGFLFVFIGVAFYYLRRWRWTCVAVMGAYTLICLAAVPEFWLTHLFVFLSVIPMCLYNGTPGTKRHKYLFYWYYPLHVYAIYIAGWALITYLGVAA